MPWTPESGSPLTTPMSLLTFEESAHKLWHEFLLGWFSGSSHVLRQVDAVNQSVTFPSVPSDAIQFQQAALKQELNGLGIGIILVASPRVMHQRMFRGSQRKQFRVAWMFYIRAKVNQTAAGGRNSESLCRQCSDLLFALLTIQANHGPLHDAGIANIRTEPARLVTSTDYSMRTMSVSATVIVQSAHAAVT